MSSLCLCVSVVNCLFDCYSDTTPDPASVPPMSRPLRALAALALAALPALAAPPTTPDWAFDVLKLKNGVVHKGLLLEDGPAGVRFQIIGRKPGRPTVWLTVAFKKEDVLKLEKLPDDERAALKAK